jgi:hypothetical protein
VGKPTALFCSKDKVVLMKDGINLSKFKNEAKLKDRYTEQLQRLQNKSIATDSIELAVQSAIQIAATCLRQQV